MTSEDWDFTKDKLDLNLLHDIKKRDKKEERNRLMSNLNSEKPKLMFISPKSLRDSTTSD
jgi:hypothetical protein